MPNKNKNNNNSNAASVIRTSAQKRALKELSTAIVGLKSRYVVSGHADVGDRVCVITPGGDNKDARIFSLPDDAAALYEAGAPATFGRGQEEVLDPEYRSARAFQPEKFIPSVPDLHRIVQKVSRVLLPGRVTEFNGDGDRDEIIGNAGAQHTDMDIDVIDIGQDNDDDDENDEDYVPESDGDDSDTDGEDELYTGDECDNVGISGVTYLVPELCKMNVYKEGDMFRPHVDTITDPRLVASLVLCLPSPFTGGELTVSHGDDKHVVKFGGSGAVDDDDADEDEQCNWAAFYTDCVHEILPVTSGYRVTVTYNLLGVRDSIQHSPLVIDSPIISVIRAVLRSGFKGKLAVPAQHAYPHTSGLKFELKGADAVVYSAAKSLNLRVKLVPFSTDTDLLECLDPDRDVDDFLQGEDEIQYSDDENASGNDEGEDGINNDGRNHGKRFKIGGLYYKNFSKVDILTTGDDYGNRFENIHGSKRIVWIPARDPFNEQVSHGGYAYGNEPTAKLWYTQVVIVLTI
ncbi:hypothetical protein GQ42DRAFT_165432 [Ramicandelaber brevisporus]|nr:hypothetical protein GQ42DRAFT_165432 [Ramicandelaber brevisporus]